MNAREAPSSSPSSPATPPATEPMIEPATARGTETSTETAIETSTQTATETSTQTATATPSYRPGHRRGCPEEILVTIAGNPDQTLRGVVQDARPHAAPGRRLDGTRVVEGVRRLRIDPSTLWVEHNVERSGDHEFEHDVLMWSASLRTNPFRRRRATLRMFGSPSTNVTVLTLTPVRPRRFATRSFVRNGWRAMTELRDRIDHRPGVEVRHGPPRQRAVFGSA